MSAPGAAILTRRRRANTTELPPGRARFYATLRGTQRPLGAVHPQTRTSAIEFQQENERPCRDTRSPLDALGLLGTRMYYSGLNDYGRTAVRPYENKASIASPEGLFLAWHRQTRTSEPSTYWRLPPERGLHTGCTRNSGHLRLVGAVAPSPFGIGCPSDPPEQLPQRVCSRWERHPLENLAEARFTGGIAAPGGRATHYYWVMFSIKAV
jgi:hypothetical protein